MTLLYLLIKRHCLIVEFAQNVVIDVDEIEEAEESIENIWAVVQNRLDGLKGNFLSRACMIKKFKSLSSRLPTTEL